MIVLNKYYCYEFTYNSSLFIIECRYDIFYSYIYKNKKSTWFENKDTTLDDAIDTCLKEIGIPRKERESIKYQFK